MDVSHKNCPAFVRQCLKHLSGKGWVDDPGINKADVDGLDFMFDPALLEEGKQGPKAEEMKPEWNDNVPDKL